VFATFTRVAPRRVRFANTLFPRSTRRGAAYRQIILKHVPTPSLTGADGGRFRLVGVEGALAELAGLVTCEEHGVQDQQE
jgi:hypothetical protein